jgi:hypothetical protein
MADEVTTNDCRHKISQVEVTGSALQALWSTCSLFKRLGGRLIPKNSAFLR